MLLWSEIWYSIISLPDYGSSQTILLGTKSFVINNLQKNQINPWINICILILKNSFFPADFHIKIFIHLKNLLSDMSFISEFLKRVSSHLKVFQLLETPSKCDMEEISVALVRSIEDQKFYARAKICLKGKNKLSSFYLFPWLIHNFFVALISLFCAIVYFFETEQKARIYPGAASWM